tara:strand:- start:11497 stop:13170 length:1674 start_codon:yes stop_codon:yes gene_type:complete
MTTFQLPFLEPKIIEKNIREDLDLTSAYKNILNTPNEYGKLTVELWTTTYSTNKQNIYDTQELLKKNLPNVVNNTKETLMLWDEISNYKKKQEIGFHNQYQYIEWERLKTLNYNDKFLQAMCFYNIMSPIISLCIPIFFLIFPFFILRIQKIPITISKYIEIVKKLFQKHQLAQLFSLSSNWNKNIYIIGSFFLYIMQIYTNITSCIKFYNNIKTMHKKIFIILNHIDKCIHCMNIFEKQTENMKSYSKFIENMKLHSNILKNMQSRFKVIKPFSLSIFKIYEIGSVMTSFYHLYHNKLYKKTLEYSILFCGYIDNLNCFKKAISKNLLGKCKFSKKNKFIDAYYPSVYGNTIKNSYGVTKNIIITGPNASGKTTLLKTTLFNVIISQQIGYGCYKKASLKLYHKIHSYINIPDTSGRDSLFQAEARRCKDILESICNNSESLNHFCIFDELYSGTNHYEAICSATSFLNYVSKYKNVSVIITTHFIDLCKHMEKNINYKNCYMETEEIDCKLIYKYKLKEGITKIKGGVKVLEQLKYPEEIINNTLKMINNTFDSN